MVQDLVTCAGCRFFVAAAVSLAGHRAMVEAGETAIAGPDGKPLESAAALKAFDAAAAAAAGVCRRYPPGAAGQWAAVLPVEWCGEWEARPLPAATIEP